MALRRHLRILTGGIDPARLRCVTACWPSAADREPTMTPVLKVAFATSDRHKVDQHFGAANALLIYEVGPDRASVSAFAQFGDLDQDGHEGKLAAKFALLQGCAVVYCQAIGGSAIQQLIGLGVEPARGGGGTPVMPLLTHLPEGWCRGAGPAWLQRLIARQGQTDAARFAVMEADGWQD